MKKIMFNDKYGLTKAVLEGRKTQIRRIINLEPSVYRIHGYKTLPDGCVCLAQLRKDGVWIVSMKPKSLYKKGEEVAVAQSYRDIMRHYHSLGHLDTRKVSAQELVFRNAMREIESKGNDSAMRGDENKMFVRADLMPHRIKITNIRIERLQDISDEDCLKEGVEYSHKGGYYVGYDNKTDSHTWLGKTPKEAFASLIDKVSGKGTWDSNPYVFVYDFELVK